VFPKLRKQLGLGGTNRSKSSKRSGSNGSDETKEELYKKAQEAGVEGRSSMTKDELAKAVQNA
jgi:hypothetical protein